MFQHRGMRLIFMANLISMVGSGMNSAAVIWYILQATHSEVSLGALIALQTLPSLLLLPFTGVLIDREDRRHLMLWLDSARGAIIFFVAMLVFTHHVRLWHLYAMNVLVAIGFWMFFPTVNALIQELTPDDKMLDSNSLLLAALQGGWLMAGAVVGFMYNHVGLGGVLLIDCASYAVSLACILQVRKGRVTVSRPISEHATDVTRRRSRTLYPRTRRRLPLRAGEPPGAADRHRLGAVCRRHDDPGGAVRAAERTHPARRSRGLWMAECRLGGRSLRQRFLRFDVYPAAMGPTVR